MSPPFVSFSVVPYAVASKELSLAAIRGEEEMVQVLLMSGAEANAADCLGVTPLYQAGLTGGVATCPFREQANQSAHCKAQGFDPEKLGCKTCRVLEKRLKEGGVDAKELSSQCLACCTEDGDVLQTQTAHPFLRQHKLLEICNDPATSSKFQWLEHWVKALVKNQHKGVVGSSIMKTLTAAGEMVTSSFGILTFRVDGSMVVLDREIACFSLSGRYQHWPCCFYAREQEVLD
eukprot:s2225_g14.t1